MKDLVSIIIPVYKKKPTPNELISFKQVLTILGKYPFSIVCPSDLDLSFYESRLTDCNVKYDIQRFDNIFFENTQSYNRLMLSRGFYKRFEKYTYILIYQLDAYVFRDELDHWCSVGYDYIGAPWSDDFQCKPTSKNTFTGVGNGGFSLRKTKAFIDRLKYFYPVKSLSSIKDQFRHFKKWPEYIKYPMMILKSLGYKNTMKYYSKYYPHNEDYFWCIFLKGTKVTLDIPDVETASRFAMEVGSEQLYKLNENQLPFGCHAWEKYEFSFWRNFITIE